MDLRKLIDPDKYYLEGIFNQPSNEECDLLYDMALEMFNVTKQEIEPLVKNIFEQKAMLLDHIMDNEIIQSDLDGYTLPDIAKALENIKSGKCETVHFSIHFDKDNKNEPERIIPLDHSVIVEKLFNAFLGAVKEIDLTYDNIPKKPGKKPSIWAKSNKKDYVKQALEFIKQRPIPEPSENKYFIFTGIVLVLAGVLPPAPKDNLGGVSSKYDGKYTTYLTQNIKPIIKG